MSFTINSGSLAPSCSAPFLNKLIYWNKLNHDSSVHWSTSTPPILVRTCKQTKLHLLSTSVVLLEPILPAAEKQPKQGCPFQTRTAAEERRNCPFSGNLALSLLPHSNILGLNPITMVGCLEYTRKTIARHP